jgi:PAS domain S-box-containing protein
VLTGYPATTFYNTPYFLDVLVHPEDNARWQAYQTTYQEPMQTKPTALELRLYHRDGGVRWVQYTMTPVTDSDNQTLLGYRASCIDITERHQFIAALEQARHSAEVANHAKSRFLANITHELRTPLNAVIGYSDILFEELHEQSYPELTEYVRHIQSAGTHLLNLINDVLELSHLETGQTQLYFSIFQPSAIINDVVQMVNFINKKNENQLSLEINKSGLGEMYSDLVKVRQILFNLLNNACKFTHHGCVTVRARREHQAGCDWVIFEIKDTGIGMTQKQKSQLFQPFSQGDDSSTRRYGGTGLGLCLTRYFTEMLGGEIQVQSEYNVGSLFTVQLPAISTENTNEMNFMPFTASES